MNYAHGVPIFCVSIAYAENDQIQLGVVYDPMQDECFSAERGQGAWLNGQADPRQCPGRPRPGFSGDGLPLRSCARPSFNNIELFGRMMLTSQSVRRLGSAALDLGYIAAGRFDGYWEIRLKPWDLAAGALIVEEAGGIVTAFDGDPNLSQTALWHRGCQSAAAPGLVKALQ